MPITGLECLMAYLRKPVTIITGYR